MRPIGRLSEQEAGYLLGVWQAKELRLARGYPECRRLSPEQLEDIYQETTLALLRRPHEDPNRLRQALRTGIRHRALNARRDEQRRREILVEHAPYLTAQDHIQDTPEQAVLTREDRRIVTEFLTELTGEEQRVFVLLAEGLKYRAIASLLGIKTNTARNIARACERKRAPWQLLYDTGRLCGYRAQTIHAIQEGKTTSEQLARRASAHLDSCPRCRTEHKTNAQRLQSTFREQAAALLPTPIFTRPLHWLTRLRGASPTTNSEFIREKAPALLASTSASAKVIATIATIATIAGALKATNALEHPSTHHSNRSAPATPAHAPTSYARPVYPGPIPDAGRPATHRILPARSRLSRALRTQNSEIRREPGGFAYLGVALPRHRRPPDRTVPKQAGGGPFGP